MVGRNGQAEQRQRGRDGQSPSAETSDPQEDGEQAQFT